MTMTTLRAFEISDSELRYPVSYDELREALQELASYALDLEDMYCEDGEGEDNDNVADNGHAEPDDREGRVNVLEQLATDDAMDDGELRLRVYNLEQYASINGTYEHRLKKVESAVDTLVDGIQRTAKSL